ncbi:hypothetical protein RJ639_023075 [Escallonia herrerae]|uniref:Peptidase A1 domain-containing protein n=1 Tax=Escallonia herrerae TaxID=1293975 RepID=A0AA88V1B2_9ASTE|nr:hypothetical protein RJ639_023075 [Escallonia herrerae]
MNGFTIDLIHRDSGFSPFYNPATHHDTVFHDRRPIARRNTRFHPYPESTVKPSEAEFLMKISIGSPPVESYAIADTGSEVVWVQCVPCDNCDKNDYSSHLFNPLKSSTYKELSCRSRPCQGLPKNFRLCDSVNSTIKPKRCDYFYGYVDLSYTIGVLSSDTFTFASAKSHGRSVSLRFPKSTFGCVHTTNGSFDSQAAGLVGLGRGQLSLITQLGDQINHKFSYCLLPATSNTTSKLRFRDQAVLTGKGVVSTLIFSEPEDPSYYLKLEAVSIGKKKIVNSHFTPAGKGNIICDSGTPLIYLKTDFYNQVEAAVRDAISLKAIKNPDPESKFKSFDRYPEIKIVFHFTGASVTLKTVNTFLGDEKMTCLTMAATEGDAFFGNLAQINFQVEYDLASNQVSFVPADCSKY